MYGGVQGFQVRKDIIITTRILSFFGIGERLLLDQKKGGLKKWKILTIMESIAKLRKRIAELDNVSSDHIKKVNNGRYLLFETKEHYKIIEYLEKMVFDFVNQVITCEVEDYTDFFILAQMSIIENYMKKFPLSNLHVKSFDIFSRSEGEEVYVSPFEATFPTLDYYFKKYYFIVEENSNYKKLMKKLKKMKSEVEERFRKLKDEIYLLD